MSINIFVNASIANISSAERNKIVQLLEKAGLKYDEDFEVDEQLDLNILKWETCWIAIDIVKKEVKGK